MSYWNQMTRSQWHISAWVDVCAYHFSWLWVLLPMTAMKSAGYGQILVIQIFIITINFFHIHASLPFAFLDSNARRGAGRRLLFWPLTLLVLFVITARAPEDSSWIKNVLPIIVLLTGTWNIWHTLMQKYGILRLYNAKGGFGSTEGTPGWIDRLLVFGWLPFLIVFLTTHYRLALWTAAEAYGASIVPVLNFVYLLRSFLFPIGILIGFSGTALWFWKEYKIHGLSNRPRLSMAAGILTGLGSFLVFDPILVYFSIGFSHSLEYLVFVGKFLQVKYQKSWGNSARTWITALSLMLPVGLIYGVVRYRGMGIAPSSKPFSAVGLELVLLIYYWELYQSLLHYYFDGFLWKIRKPEIRTYLS